MKVTDIDVDPPFLRFEHRGVKKIAVLQATLMSRRVELANG